jgi:hypothetical protein
MFPSLNNEVKCILTFFDGRGPTAGIGRQILRRHNSAARSARWRSGDIATPCRGADRYPVFAHGDFLAVLAYQRIGAVGLHFSAGGMTVGRTEENLTGHAAASFCHLALHRSRGNAWSRRTATGDEREQTNAHEEQAMREPAPPNGRMRRTVPNHASIPLSFASVPYLEANPHPCMILEPASDAIGSPLF